MQDTVAKVDFSSLITAGITFLLGPVIATIAMGGVAVNALMFISYASTRAIPQTNRTC